MSCSSPAACARMETFPARTLFEQLQHLVGPQLEAAGIRLRIEALPGITCGPTRNNSSRS